MKKYAFIILVLLFSVSVLKSQDKEKRTVPAFQRLDLNNGVNVQYIKSDKYYVEITTQIIMPKDVATRVVNDQLIIRVDSKMFEDYKVNINLYCPVILEITASGKSEISTKELMKQDTLRVGLETGAIAYLSLDINKLNSHIIEGSTLSVDGYAVEQNALVATGATLSAFELESDKVVIKAVTGGKAKIMVEKELIANVSTGGQVMYKGEPPVKETKVGLGGKVEKLQ